MRSLFTRLLTGGASYQAASVLSAALALVTLPLYTRALSRSDFGVAETLLTFIILASILLRMGLGEAFVRFYFATPEGLERDRLARTTTATVLLTSTAAAIVAALLAGPLSRLVLGFEEAPLMRIAVLGLWAFTNLDIAYGLLRVDERRRVYLVASLCNVALTVALTVTLVVVLDQGARGYLLATTRPRRSSSPGCGGRCARGSRAGRAGGASRCGRCWRSACRRCPPTRRCSR